MSTQTSSTHSSSTHSSSTHSSSTHSSSTHSHKATQTDKWVTYETVPRHSQCHTSMRMSTQPVSTQSQWEVGGWGRDPKKCTGRHWGMGSSTISWKLRPVVKYHLRRGVGFMKFLENGSRPQPPTSRLSQCVDIRNDMWDWLSPHSLHNKVCRSHSNKDCIDYTV